MSDITRRDWEEANQAHLMAALAEVRIALEKFLARPGEASSSDSKHDEVSRAGERVAMLVPPSVETLCAAFGLSDFERKVLLMCAGVEMDSRFRTLYAAASNDPRHSLPTFSLALAAFQDAHWSALLPSRPLRYWHLIEMLAADSLTSSPLRIDETILHYLAGVPAIDERLGAITTLLPAAAVLSLSQAEAANKLVHYWS